MAAVDIGVRHDDDLVVADLVDVEGAFAFAGADARPDGGDHGLDFLVFEGLVESGLFHVDEFAAEWEDGLGAAVASLLGGAAGGIAFDDEEFAEGGVFFRAVGEFAGEAAAGEGAFADSFAGFAGGFAGTGGRDDFVDDAFGERGIFLEVLAESFVGDAADDAFDFVIDEFVLRLAGEARVGEFDAEDADEAFAAVVAGDGGILFALKVIGFGVGIDGAGEGGAEAREVGAAVAVEDAVGVAVDLFRVAVGVLDDEVDVEIFRGFAGFQFEAAFAADDDGVGWGEVLVFAHLVDEFDDAAVVAEGGVAFLFAAFVREIDGESGIEEGEFAQAGGEAVELEFRGDLEDFGVG